MSSFFQIISDLLISNPIYAPLLFITIHVTLSIFLIPCSPMTILAGVLWGPKIGFIISYISMMLSISITFMLSRNFQPLRIKRLIARLPKKILNNLGNIKSIFFFQSNPILPSSSLGYIFGSSKIKFIKYFILASLFNLPLQYVFVVFGDMSTKYYTTIWFWIITLLIFIYIITRYIKRNYV